MDADTQIKRKLKDLQKFTPLLEEMLKYSKIGDKNAATHEKLEKMHKIVSGIIPCTKLLTLMRIEEAILKWNERRKAKQAAQESPIVLNRLHELKKRMTGIELSKNPAAVINLDSSDDDDVEIVSYTAPEPKKDGLAIEKDIPSTSGIDEIKSSDSEDQNNKTSSDKGSIKSEIKSEGDVNAHSEFEDGELDEDVSVVSVVDCKEMDIESAKTEEDFSTKAEKDFLKRVCDVTKKVEEDFFKKVDDFSKKVENTKKAQGCSKEPPKSFHGKPALKTYGSRKIGKSDENTNDDDLRAFLNSIRNKKQSTVGENSSRAEPQFTTNEGPDTTSPPPVEDNKKETLVVQIRNSRATVKKDSIKENKKDDRIINVTSVKDNDVNIKADLPCSALKTHDKCKTIQPIVKTLKTPQKKTEASSNAPIVAKKTPEMKEKGESKEPNLISKKRVVKIIEIFTEDAAEKTQNITTKASRVEADDLEEISTDEEKYDSGQNASSRSKKNRRCEKHKKSLDEIVGDAGKSDTASTTTNDHNRKIKNKKTLDEGIREADKRDTASTAPKDHNQKNKNKKSLDEGIGEAGKSDTATTAPEDHNQKNKNKKSLDEGVCEAGKSDTASTTTEDHDRKDKNKKSLDEVLGEAGKSDVNSTKTENHNQETEHKSTDKYLDILYNIDFSQDEAESELDKDQDLDIFDEAIYSGARIYDKNEKRNRDRNRSEVFSRKKSEEIISSSSLEQEDEKAKIAFSRKLPKTDTESNNDANQTAETSSISDLNPHHRKSLEEGEILSDEDKLMADAETSDTPCDNGVLWLHDSDTENFIKELNLAIGLEGRKVKVQPKNHSKNIRKIEILPQSSQSRSFDHRQAKTSKTDAYSLTAQKNEMQESAEGIRAKVRLLSHNSKNSKQSEHTYCAQEFSVNNSGTMVETDKDKILAAKMRAKEGSNSSLKDSQTNKRLVDNITISAKMVEPSTATKAELSKDQKKNGQESVEEQISEILNKKPNNTVKFSTVKMARDSMSLIQTEHTYSAKALRINKDTPSVEKDTEQNVRVKDPNISVEKSSNSLEGEQRKQGVEQLYCTELLPITPPTNPNNSNEESNNPPESTSAQVESKNGNAIKSNQTKLQNDSQFKLSDIIAKLSKVVQESKHEPEKPIGSGNKQSITTLDSADIKPIETSNKNIFPCFSSSKDIEDKKSIIEHNEIQPQDAKESITEANTPNIERHVEALDESEALSPQSDKPLFERRSDRKELEKKTDATMPNHQRLTEQNKSTLEDYMNISDKEKEAVADLEVTNVEPVTSTERGPQRKANISKGFNQLDEWASKDLSELQEIRLQLEKQMGIDLATIFQTEQNEATVDYPEADALAIDRAQDTLAMDVAQEIEDAMRGEDFMDEPFQSDFPTYPMYHIPMDFFTESNLPSYNLPQYLGLPPEIKPNDPRLRSRLSLLYAKTTDPLQAELSNANRRRPQLPTADEVLGSQAGKVQEEIQSACMKEVGQMVSQISRNIQQNQPIPSTSSNRPRALTYGEYKRLKQAALEAEAARKKSAFEATDRVHQLELETYRERKQIRKDERERLRVNELEDNNDSSTDGEIILPTRKKKTCILNFSTDSEDSKKSSTRHKLKKKKTRTKSQESSSGSEIEINSINSDTVNVPTDAVKPCRPDSEDRVSIDASQEDALKTLLGNKLEIDTTDKDNLKKIAFTLMKSLLKKQKFAEFEKLLESSFEPESQKATKSVSSTSSANSKNKISCKELAALNEDLHKMFSKDNALMIGRRKSSIKGMKLIEEHYASLKQNENVKEDSNKTQNTVFSDEDADTDDFDEFLTLKKQLEITRMRPIVRLKKLTPEEILKYTKYETIVNPPEETSQCTEDDHDLLKPMKAVPFTYAAARRQSQSGKPKSKTDIKNTNEAWHYKDKFFSVYCLFCCKKITNLVDHYVIYHPNTEIFIARLPPTDIEYLAKNPGVGKTFGERNKHGQYKYIARCFFCGLDIKGRSDKFSQHYATHTGEFPYECSACNFMSCHKGVVTKHTKICQKDAKALTYYSYDENITKISLYLCTKCNYMQLHKANVVLHLRREHECKFVCETDIRELLLVELVEEEPQQNIQIVNEPIPTSSKSEDVEIIFEIQTGGKIDIPFVKKDKDSDTDSIISNISIDMKTDMFPFQLLPTESTAESTQIVPDLSKFDAEGENIVTVIHIPTTVGDENKNSSVDKSVDFEQFLRELNPLGSTSAQSNNQLVSAKPKVNSGTETVLKLPTPIKPEPQDEGKESSEKFHQTNKVEEDNSSVDQSKKPTISDLPCDEQKQIIKVKHEKNRCLSEEMTVEEGLITVIEIVDDEKTENDLPKVGTLPDFKDWLAPLRIENFGYQEIRESEYLFHCLIDNCNFGVTISFEVLKDHLKEHDVKWSGKCNICKDKLTLSLSMHPIDEELDHMLTIHIKEIKESQDDDRNHALIILKPWLSGTKSKKKKILCEGMLIPETLLCNLYKCMGDDCSFTCETKVNMSKHLATHELKAMGKAEFNRSWLECCYCEFSANKTIQILEHIENVHSSSIFQCSRCFYRSCAAVNVEIHQDQYHPSNVDKNKTLTCSGDRTTLVDEINRVSKLAATNVLALSCSACGANYFRRDLMIKHLQDTHKEIGIPKGFPMGLFSCIFCKFETDELEQIRSHMANKHPEELLYIGVREISDKNCTKDKPSIAYIGVEKDKEGKIESITQQPQPGALLSSSNQTSLKSEKENIGKLDLRTHETNDAVLEFKNNLMNLRDLEQLCNPSITIDSDDESCGNEVAEVNDESSIALYKKLIETLKYFIKSESGVSPCWICLEIINFEEDWSNHFNKAHKDIKPSEFRSCPLCPVLCSFASYPQHYQRCHNKPGKTYFCYFCGKNFTVLAAAKLHLMSHSVFEHAKLIRVKMKQDANEVSSEDSEIDYQIILPRRYQKKIVDIIKHMIDVLGKRKMIEEKVTKPLPDKENLTIDLNENIRGTNYPLFVAAPTRFVCTYCSIQLMDERSFEQHFTANHSTLQVFKCPHCEVTLFNLSDFSRARDHIRLHSGIFFMCFFCKMYTSNRNYLMAHIQKYKRDCVPIVCFARTVVNVKHHFELIHFVPESKGTCNKNKCIFCALYYNDKDLDAHLMQAHQHTRQYQCDYCAVRGDPVEVDSHVVAVHAGNSFRSKTIFQKNAHLRKYYKRKSDDLGNLSESSQDCEKKKKADCDIIELESDEDVEIISSTGPTQSGVIGDTCAKDLPVSNPPAQGIAENNNPSTHIKDLAISAPLVKNIAVKNPPIKDIPVTNPLVKNIPVTNPPAKNIPVNNPPVKDPPVNNPPVKYPSVKNPPVRDPPCNNASVEVPPIINPVKNPPVQEVASPTKDTLKCDFCPLKCISNEDLIKHLKSRHGITLIDSGNDPNDKTMNTTSIQTVTTTVVKRNTTTTTAAVASTFGETTVAPDSKTPVLPETPPQVIEPPKKKIRLVPLDKLLDPKAKIAHAAHSAQKLNTIQISGVMGQQLVTNPAQTNESVQYECKFTCFHCSTQFNTQEELAIHWQNPLSCPSKWNHYICFHCSSHYVNVKSLQLHWQEAPDIKCSAKPNGSYRYRLTNSQSRPLGDFITTSFLDRMTQLSQYTIHNKIVKSACYQCPDCSQTYFDQTTCLNHIKTKMKTPYFCTYSQEVILFGCEECRIFFTKEEDSVKHMAIHTFRFVCLFCGSAYKTLYELYAHYDQIHRSIERKYKYDTTSPRNMAIYKEMLVVFPCGLILTKDDLWKTYWGNIPAFTKLIEDINKDESTTAMQS